MKLIRQSSAEGTLKLDTNKGPVIASTSYESLNYVVVHEYIYM